MDLFVVFRLKPHLKCTGGHAPHSFWFLALCLELGFFFAFCVPHHMFKPQVLKEP